jgi:chromosome partitioning protein
MITRNNFSGIKESILNLRSIIMLITVLSFKGGVGKSTTAIHLAAFLSRKGQTALIDGDLNRSVIDWAERASEPPPFAVLDESNIDDFSAYRYTVIDTPARPSDEDLIGLAESSDLVVIPTMCDAFSIVALVKTTNLLVPLSHRYRVLLTACPPKPSKEAQKAREALTDAGLPLFKGQISRLSAFQKAALEGVPVYGVKDARAGQGWKDYEAIGKEVLKWQT